MAVANANQPQKTVADPCAAYDSLLQLWSKSRAVLSGERFVKDFDGTVDTVRFSNLLLPFSPTMAQDQYNFYKAEAELPGIVVQYAKTIVGGLLRKQPQLKLPDGIPKDAYQWIMDGFAQDSSPMVSFLDSALWEEAQTSRAWVYVDYPNIPVLKRDAMTAEEVKAIKPYPVLWRAESVINWRTAISSESGSQILDRVIVRNYESKFTSANEFHPTLLDTVWVHEIVEGLYQIRKYQKQEDNAPVLVVSGQNQQQYSNPTATNGTSASTQAFILIETITELYINGERATVIPAWPLNGSIEPTEPMLIQLIDREIGLYNKVSRRNHLLYGAATYTPVIIGDLPDTDFEDIVSGGLGSWLKLPAGCTAEALATPTDALADMDRAIAAGYEEMARLGIRMLSPETAQSGVALDIRNASQTAQLGVLNIKVSSQLADIIAFMLNWRYDLKLTSVDIEFTLSVDFNPTPLGADWLRLVTEWYQGGIIPRSVWLQILKINDIVPPDYDDEEGLLEINKDDLVISPAQSTMYDAQVAQEAGIFPKKAPPSPADKTLVNPAAKT
jgi:hypothetical protein